MKISSVDTDKNSDGNWCAWATVLSGRVTSVSDELGREGGELWNNKGFNPNGDLKDVLAGLARNWPNFYKEVRKQAYLQTKLLPTIRKIKKDHILRDINTILGEVEEFEAKILERNKKLRRLRKKINKL